MKAVVWHGVGDIRLDTVADPKLEEDTDALIRITRSAICGTDLHLVRDAAMNKNLLTLKMGNCDHRRYVPKLLGMVGTGGVEPTRFITRRAEPESAVAAYESFDRRADGWLKTVLSV
jgi:threonine dehydrogenase-like Zn-dependent dehydrogenase